MEAELILTRLAEQSGTPIWGVNISETREIHPLLAVNQVPTVVTIRNGALIKKVVGLQNEGTYRKLLGHAPRLREDGTEAAPLRVTVYTTRTCPHCTTVKNHLKRKGVPFKEVDVSRDAQAASKLQRRTGQTGVPQTDINGTFVLGANIPQINKLIGI
ncbi:MAG: glutaredoxin [Deltaproteobacteria bacterium]|nr:glutaredoxin [Deltaproteobacteria bacterium]